jgi:hypothetical protein
MFNDDQFAGRGRQLYQFAGVDASATYGIFLPPTFDFGDDFGGDAPETLPNVLVDLTGGFPTEIPTRPVAATEVLDEAQNVIARGVDLVIQSLSFFARSPREAALAAAVWFLLGLPGYLAARRRRLQARRAM